MLGAKLIAALLTFDGAIHEYHRLGLKEQLFRGGEEELYGVVSSHVLKYGVLPAKETIELKWGSVLPDSVPEPPAYYRDKLWDRHVHLQIKQACLDAQQFLNGGDPQGALTKIRQETMELYLSGNKNKIVDYASEGHDLIKAEMLKKLKQGDDYGLMFGWPTLDGGTGGLQAGDLVSIVGRPAAGKTFMMLYAALHAWKTSNRPMFVSMEMKPMPIVQRIAAMDTHTNITHLKHATLANEKWADVKAVLKKNQSEHPFWVIDGALASTVEDIVLYARQFKPTVVFVDAAYLMRSSNNRLGRWERVTDNAERLKGDLAEGLGIPAVISYQFNRDSLKKKPGEKPGLENIAYTDAIGQLSSVVLGLMQEDSVETMETRTVSILKGRNGETGEFKIKWNFTQYPQMDFSEVKELLLEDFKHL